MYNEDQLLPISALQHLLYCERQCALIHLEQAWADNRWTAEGTAMHERVHEQGGESRSDVRTATGVRLRSLRLGLTGQADVVEFHRAETADGNPVADRLVIAEKDRFYMTERSRRPPLDNLNALLSFLYTLLAHDAEGACEGIGLDPQVGFLHALRPGRPSLALDLMEEFRPVIADRLALSLINLRQISGKGFKKTETGAVIMDDDTRKTVLAAYQKRKQETVRHTFLREELPIVNMTILVDKLLGLNALLTFCGHFCPLQPFFDREKAVLTAEDHEARCLEIRAAVEIRRCSDPLRLVIRNRPPIPACRYD